MSPGTSSAPLSGSRICTSRFPGAVDLRGAVGAMLCLVGYLVLLAALLALRFRSGRWRQIELIEPKLLG